MNEYLPAAVRRNRVLTLTIWTVAIVIGVAVVAGVEEGLTLIFSVLDFG
jgi:hypothetical protein